MVEMSRLEWQETGKVSEVRLRNLQIGRSSEVGRFARGLSQQSQSENWFPENSQLGAKLCPGRTGG